MRSKIQCPFFREIVAIATCRKSELNADVLTSMAGECTVRLTYVGQKANQGRLLQLVVPPAASEDDSTVGVPVNAVLELLAEAAAVDLLRWKPLWYDVAAKGWRDLEADGALPPLATSRGQLDVRLVDRSAPGGCSPEGQLPLLSPSNAAGSGSASAAIDQARLRPERRGADLGGRGTEAAGGGSAAALVDDGEASAGAAGYFGIGVVGLKTEANLGTLWRSAWQLGAAFIFTVGHRFEKQGSDTYQTWTRVPCFEHKDWAAFASASPYAAPWVAVEMGGTPLEDFEHPDRAVCK
jgi:hypothetical protein